MVNAQYQVVILDPQAKPDAGPSFSEVLTATIKNRVKDLGLDPTREIKIVTEPKLSEVTFRSPLVVVYYGGDKQYAAMTEFIESVMKNGTVVLPVVDSLDGYTSKVPSVLHPVNGAACDSTDTNHEGITRLLLEDLRLLRRRRKVFISYRRADSSQVAQQLYHAFDDRSFDVFLDTRSVERGALFQPMLWDHMADSDLVVLLDSPNAFTSQWVEHELTRVHGLGLGVLQIVWPEHQRSVGSVLCDVENLEPSDFESGNTPNRQLLESKVTFLALKAESLRARSLAARRNRIVTDLCRSASERNVRVSVQSYGALVVKHPTKGDTMVFPVLGHPDSPTIHDVTDLCGTSVENKSPLPLALFDPLGMLDKRVAHITWLNRYLPVRAMSLTEVSKWLTE